MPSAVRRRQRCQPRGLGRPRRRELVLDHLLKSVVAVNGPTTSHGVADGAYLQRWEMGRIRSADERGKPAPTPPPALRNSDLNPHVGRNAS